MSSNAWNSCSKICPCKWYQELDYFVEEEDFIEVHGNRFWKPFVEKPVNEGIRAADKPPKLQERDFSGTAYVPVYVMLLGQLGVINMDCQLVDQDNLLNQWWTGNTVVMSFHECGGNVGDDVHIPLPQWLTAIGQRNPDIFFTDKKGRHNPECLTWGIDKERILRGGTAVEGETVLDLQSLSKVKQHQVSSDEILGSN
ncbi:unnamed protein product [Camellia sinensis]